MRESLDDESQGRQLARTWPEVLFHNRDCVSEAVTKENEYAIIREARIALAMERQGFAVAS